MSVIRGAEALGLVMLCQCKAYPRRLAVHILRFVLKLIKDPTLTCPCRKDIILSLVCVVIKIGMSYFFDKMLK